MNYFAVLIPAIPAFMTIILLPTALASMIVLSPEVLYLVGVSYLMVFHLDPFSEVVLPPVSVNPAR